MAPRRSLMARSQPDEQLDLTTHERAGLVEVARQLDAAGRGWINVRPVVDEDRLPPRPGILAAIFSAKGTVLPVGTWVPSPLPDGDDERRPSTVGIAHPAGTKVATHLVEAGLRPPEGWRGIQDNPRRGLVVEIPAGTDGAVVVDWLLDAMVELCPIADVDDWRADVHR